LVPEEVRMMTPSSHYDTQNVQSCELAQETMPIPTSSHYATKNVQLCEHVQETTILQIMIRVHRMYTHVNMLILPLHNIECKVMCTSSRNCSDTYQYMY